MLCTLLTSSSISTASDFTRDLPWTVASVVWFAVSYALTGEKRYINSGVTLSFSIQLSICLALVFALSGPVATAFDGFSAFVLILIFVGLSGLPFAPSCVVTV